MELFQMEWKQQHPTSCTQIIGPRVGRRVSLIGDRSKDVIKSGRETQMNPGVRFFWCHDYMESLKKMLVYIYSYISII